MKKGALCASTTVSRYWSNSCLVITGPQGVRQKTPRRRDGRDTSSTGKTFAPRFQFEALGNGEPFLTASSALIAQYSVLVRFGSRHTLPADATSMACTTPQALQTN